MTHRQVYIQEEWEHTATPTLYTSVHGSFIHHGRNVETPKGPPRAEWLNEMRPALRSDSEHSVVGRVQPPTARAAELSLERRRHGSPTRVPGVRLSTAHEPRRRQGCSLRAGGGRWGTAAGRGVQGFFWAVGYGSIVRKALEMAYPSTESGRIPSRRNCCKKVLKTHGAGWAPPSSPREGGAGPGVGPWELQVGLLCPSGSYLACHMT